MERTRVKMSGGCKAESGVGVIVHNWLIGKVVRVERFNDSVIKVNIITGDSAIPRVSLGIPVPVPGPGL